ncbi:segregation and condensation protein A [Vampirovibrio chlorellavorus]|uniref:segregation and condensation protein A n=1 Tax=Vampirovibrio chlorellavorus TaxID=758823 RepID=UPI0026EE8109|nr:ScpA family protein [Vampirovibrio chlorellavorus]
MQPRPEPSPQPESFSEPTKPADGVELLVEMAKSGEIDPWNIDIVKVADQYLQAVAELKESDLKITGKTLLYLAILLRMKSDQLAGINYLNPPDEFLDELLEPDFMDNNRVIQPKFSFRSLDEVIKRRTSTKQPRIRNVTLEDLILELQKYEELEKRRSLKEKVEKASHRRMMDYADFTADDIEEMAHEEFHEDTVSQLRHLLERVLIHQEQVSLTEIMERGRLDKISAFLALLFLTARGGFSMRQDEFYAEVYVAPDAPESNTPENDTLTQGNNQDNQEELAG